MNLLIQLRETETDNEIREFTEDDGNTVYISHSTEESIGQLSKVAIDKAVISIKRLQDAAILKYLNDYYPMITVVVITSKTFDDILSAFHKANYSVVHEPLRLAELRGKLSNTHESKVIE